MSLTSAIVNAQLRQYKARIFLLVDLWDFFLDLGSEDEKKSSGHFQSFFFFFFLISPEQTVKLVK